MVPQQLLTPDKARHGDELLCQPADPNLQCAICCSLFTTPMRTACGCAELCHASSPVHLAVHVRYGDQRCRLAPAELLRVVQRENVL